MSIVTTIAAASAGRLSGPSQRDGRSPGTRGGAAQACPVHPLEYPMVYAI